MMFVFTLWVLAFLYPAATHTHMNRLAHHSRALHFTGISTTDGTGDQHSPPTDAEVDHSPSADSKGDHLPEQGYHGKKVKHENMKSATKDWREEYGPTKKPQV